MRKDVAQGSVCTAERGLLKRDFWGAENALIRSLLGRQNSEKVMDKTRVKKWANTHYCAKIVNKLLTE